jgi:DNA-binding NtrC family response regulator
MDAVGNTHRGTNNAELPCEPEAMARTPDRRQAATRTLRVLHVDQDRALRESCARLLEDDGCRVTGCRRGEEALEILGRQVFDVVLLELDGMVHSDFDFLGHIHAKLPTTRVIVTSARPSVHSSVAAFRNGAWDYVPKPFSATQLQILIGRAAHELSAARAEHALPIQEHPDDAHHPIAVLGASATIREIIGRARRVAATDASVFITGESGTGKERLSEFIHTESRRQGGPFVAINCAAIPEALLETELFGHRKGAFTGAVDEKQGLLEVAHGGTFLLDELTQMPLSTQAKLLRVIQDGVVRRVGSDAVNAVVDVRFIAVTNQPPDDAIRAGRLREDLYYRLRVFPIHLPPLRERREDIPLLADHFLRLFWTRHRGNSPRPRLSELAIEALVDHPWRGNIRELQNVIEHGVVLFEPGTVIQPIDIPFAVNTNGLRELQPPVESFSQLDPEDHGFFECRDRLLNQFEYRYVQWLMTQTAGNLSKAARIAGMQRTTLYRLIEKHGLHRQMTVLPSEQH